MDEVDSYRHFRDAKVQKSYVESLCAPVISHFPSLAVLVDAWTSHHVISI
jgi:hypothetical protein